MQIVKYNIRKWKNTCMGIPCFILGNGPSLTKKDVKKLKPYFTIGVNRIFYLYNPTLLLWQDYSLWKTEKKNILKSKAVKVCLSKGDPEDLFSHVKFIPRVKFNRKIINEQFGEFPDLLCRFSNTGILAVQMAIAMGCSCVVLLGMDGRYSKEDINTNFYGVNKFHTYETLINFDKSLRFLKGRKDIAIYNCSDNKYWKRYKLKNVLKILKPKKGSRDHFINIFNKKERY